MAGSLGSMLLVYRAREFAAEELERELRPWPRHVTPEWLELEALAPRAECVLAAFGPSASGTDVRRLRQLRLVIAVTPCIALMPERARLVRELLGVSAVEVLFWPAERGTLAGVVAGTLSSRPLERLARFCERREDWGVELRVALVAALRRAWARRDIGSLAATAGVHRTTLHRQALRAGLPPLSHLLALIDLARCEALRAGGFGWAEAARAVGLSPRTLWRQARARLGRSPAHVEAGAALDRLSSILAAPGSPTAPVATDWPRQA